MMKVLPSFLGDDIIESILRKGDNGKWQPGAVGDDGRTVYRPTIREVDVQPLNLYDSPSIYNLIDTCLKIYNIQTLQYNILGVNEITLLRYQPGGHYDFHADFFEHPVRSQRRITLIAQLTDPSEYEGGEFLLEKEQYHVSTDELWQRKQKGTILMFDSKERHMVRPITSGQRKSIVAWAIGRE